MYTGLLYVHSLLRWIVLVFLILTICRAYLNWRSGKKFSRLDNALRHWTATIGHIQLIAGILLYSQSPIASYLWHNLGDATFEMFFFGVIHIVLMITAIVVITIGSALARRKERDHEKFRTVFTWFSLGFLIILIAVPWPFSPLATRPYFR